MRLTDNAGDIKNKDINYRSLLSQTGINILFSLTFAILMGISANSFFYLPFTPVPVTMQVFTVLLSALFLGKYWAMIAQIEYIILGLYGFPVFAGFKSGATALWGPTGGYIIGFVFGAFTTGYIFDKLKTRQQEDLHFKTGKSTGAGDIFITFIAGIAGLSVIYISGLVHLTGFLYIAAKNPAIIEVVSNAIKIGVAPFIIFDIAKITALLGLQKLFKRKE